MGTATSVTFRELCRHDQTIQDIMIVSQSHPSDEEDNDETTLLCILPSIKSPQPPPPKMHRQLADCTTCRAKYSEPNRLTRWTGWRQRGSPTHPSSYSLMSHSLCMCPSSGRSNWESPPCPQVRWCSRSVRWSWAQALDPHLGQCWLRLWMKERGRKEINWIHIRKYRSKSYLESRYNFTLADHRDTELGGGG